MITHKLYQAYIYLLKCKRCITIAQFKISCFGRRSSSKKKKKNQNRKQETSKDLNSNSTMNLH